MPPALVEGCYIFSWKGQAFSWMHILPTIITLSITIASLRRDGRKEFLPFAFGLYLHAWQFALWAFQVHFSIVRPDPICAQHHTYAFPSQEAFYVGALVAAFVTYSAFWRYPLGWITWLFLYCLVLGPPFVLVWNLHNRIWELAVSMGLGAIAGVLFISVVAVYITPMLPYVCNQAPWTWFHTCDTWCMDDVQRERCRYIRMHARGIERHIAARARFLRHRRG